MAAIEQAPYMGRRLASIEKAFQRGQQPLLHGEDLVRMGRRTYRLDLGDQRSSLRVVVFGPDELDEWYLVQDGLRYREAVVAETSLAPSVVYAGPGRLDQWPTLFLIETYADGTDLSCPDVVPCDPGWAPIVRQVHAYMGGLRRIPVVPNDREVAAWALGVNRRVLACLRRLARVVEVRTLSEHLCGAVEALVPALSRIDSWGLVHGDLHGGNVIARGIGGPDSAVTGVVDDRFHPGDTLYDATSFSVWLAEATRDPRIARAPSHLSEDTARRWALYAIERASGRVLHRLDPSPRRFPGQQPPSDPVFEVNIIVLEELAAGPLRRRVT